jgi:drug/metabolite transporter (DMT)-like permease
MPAVENRKSIDAAAVGLMLVICLIWALQPIGLKFTGGYAAPVLQIGLRSGFAAWCVFILILSKRQKLQWFGRNAALGVMAGLLFAVEFFFVGEALKHTSASHVVVFLHTAPIFAGIGLHIRLASERLSLVQWAGIIIAAMGIAYAFLQPSAGSGQNLGSIFLGDLLALLGGAFWGATTVLIRTTGLSSIPAAHVLFYQLATAFVILTTAAVLTGNGHMELNAILVAQLAFQSIIVSFLSFLTWFWLLTKYKASQLGVFSFTTPLFGVVAGIVLLNEPLTAAFVIGAAGVLVGIMIVSAYPWITQRRGGLPTKNHLSQAGVEVASVVRRAEG